MGCGPLPPSLEGLPWCRGLAHRGRRRRRLWGSRPGLLPPATPPRLRRPLPAPLHHPLRSAPGRSPRCPGSPRPITSRVTTALGTAPLGTALASSTSTTTSSSGGGGGGGGGQHHLQHHYHHRRPRFRSKYMPEEDINHILRILWAAVHSSRPYQEDYYYQAFLAKHVNGANAAAFAPDALRETAPQERNSDVSTTWVPIEGLGKIAMSNIRRPKPLMDLPTSHQPKKVPSPPSRVPPPLRSPLHRHNAVRARNSSSTHTVALSPPPAKLPSMKCVDPSPLLFHLLPIRSHCSVRHLGFLRNFFAVLPATAVPCCGGVPLTDCRIVTPAAAGRRCLRVGIRQCNAPPP